eukprot:4230152-Pyramimonas_sp.AAC.1
MYTHYSLLTTATCKNGLTTNDRSVTKGVSSSLPRGTVRAAGVLYGRPVRLPSQPPRSEGV